MQRRRLGQSDIDVAAVGFGAMSLTNFYGPIDEKDALLLLQGIFDMGIDHIDTANVYGDGVSETRIGNFLRSLSASDRRSIKIATKAANGFDADGNRSIDNSREHLMSELDASLRRLGVEQVALFYVHRRDARFEIEEVTQTLADIVSSGKAQAVGFSEIAPTSLVRASKIHPIAAVQSEYSLATRSPELGLIQRTQQLDTALVAFSPVARSLLTDAPHNREKAETVRFLVHNPRFIEPHLSANFRATEGFRRLAAAFGVSAARLAIAWLLHRAPHVIPIPGSRSPERMRDMVQAVDMALSAEDLAAIETALPVGWAHGDRYSTVQWGGPEKYC